MKVTIQLIGEPAPQRYEVDSVMAEGNKLILRGKETVEIDMDQVAIFWRGGLKALTRPGVTLQSVQQKVDALKRL